MDIVSLNDIEERRYEGRTECISMNGCCFQNNSFESGRGFGMRRRNISGQQVDRSGDVFDIGRPHKDPIKIIAGCAKWIDHVEGRQGSRLTEGSTGFPTWWPHAIPEQGGQR